MKNCFPHSNNFRAFEIQGLFKIVNTVYSFLFKISVSLS